PALTEPLAEVLGELGSDGAFVVHSHDRMDELTTGGPNQVSHLKNGSVSTYELNAANYNLRPATADDLCGGDPEENAQKMRAVLASEDRGPCRDVVLLNAAAALSLTSDDFGTALTEATWSLESGAALQRLDALVAMSQSLAV
ncbi:MAG: anthranilate phosphoribosyltransferase, partial [Anaerolineae bacterium]|nr:anthranilate phosphoribosyltransferase [Anaerolineae bacterium]